MLFLSFSSMSYIQLSELERGSAFSDFAAEYFVTVVAVSVPVCLHLIFVCRDIRGDITAAPELFRFNGCNGPSIFPFSHTEKSHC